jgi:hypothetical protein
VSCIYDREICYSTYIYSYQNIAPSRFRIGDLVEARATLMLVPLRDSEFKMVCVLRGLTLVDDTVSQVKEF